MTRAELEDKLRASGATDVFAYAISLNIMVDTLDREVTERIVLHQILRQETELKTQKNNLKALRDVYGQMVADECV
jgi:hypothetical protein